MRSVPPAASPADAFVRQDPVFYAGDILHRIKQERVQNAIADAGLDALLFFKAEAVRYVTDFYVKGFRPFMEPEYLALIPRGRAPIVGHVSGSDDLRIRFKSDIAAARRLPAFPDWSATIAEMLGEYGLRRARFGADLMPAVIHGALQRECPDLEIVDARPLWTGLTAIKHPEEIRLVREAVRVADVGMHAAIAAVRPGVREHAVAAEAVYAMRKATPGTSSVTAFTASRSSTETSASLSWKTW